MGESQKRKAGDLENEDEQVISAATDGHVNSRALVRRRLSSEPNTELVQVETLIVDSTVSHMKSATNILQTCVEQIESVRKLHGIPSPKQHPHGVLNDVGCNSNSTISPTETHLSKISPPWDMINNEPSEHEYRVESLKASIMALETELRNFLPKSEKAPSTSELHGRALVGAVKARIANLEDRESIILDLFDIKEDQERTPEY